MYTSGMSDNPPGAENQQERLIKIGWVTGFVDGEGCFSIGFVRQPDRTKRKGYRTGYQVSHNFRYNLLHVIIPFFRRYPMRTAKQRDFEKFAHCVEMMQYNLHLTKNGIVTIAKIVQTMNRQKPRESLISILRGHTPKVRDTGL